MKSRIREVREGRIKENILRMRKKIKGDMVLRNVFDVIEDKEGVYVNRSLIGSKLRKEGWVRNIDGVDVLVEKRIREVKMVNRGK